MAVISHQYEAPPEVGAQYELGAVFASDETEVLAWQDRAACSGLWDVFDLPQKSSGRPATGRYKYHLRVARPICFECPVFQQCWDHAYDNSAHGVIQAGAILGSDIGAVRQKRLVVAYAMYEEYQERKRNAESDKRRRKTRGLSGTGTSAK